MVRGEALSLQLLFLPPPLPRPPAFPHRVSPWWTSMLRARSECIFDSPCSLLAASCLSVFFSVICLWLIMHPVSRLTDLVSSVRRPTAPHTDSEPSASSRPLTAPVSAPSHPSPSPAQPSSSPLPSAHCEYVVSVSVLAVLAQQHEILISCECKKAAVMLLG